MADGIVQVPPDSTGKKVDAASMDVGLNTVMRQRMIIGDDSATAQFAIVTGGALTITGTINISAMPAINISAIAAVAISGTALVAGVVSLAAGTANIGFINNISATVNVAFAGGISLAAGTANIGFLNNISATVTVAGTVSLGAGTALIGAISLAAGTANVGFINNISASVQVATGATADYNTLASADQVQTLPIFGIALPASGGAVAGGTATNPIIIGGTVDKISATVTVVGTVSLGAGTANIGFINNISATVAVSGTVSLGAGTANIGGVSLVAGTANIGFINNISATVTVAGIISVGGAVNISTMAALVAGTANIGAVSLAAGTANIGTINNISAAENVLIGLSAPAAGGNATTKALWGDKFGRPVIINNHPSLLPTASHGPKCVTCSTSAGIALIAAPGAGLSIYITEIANTNGSATLTRSDVFEASKTASCICQMYMAASGGGFVMKYDPPIQLTSNSGATCRVKPSVSQTIFNVHFYVGPK